MKILFVNTTYNQGSTGKLTKNFLDYVVERGHDAYCIYADGSAPRNINSLKVKNSFSRKLTIFLERLTGCLGAFSLVATLKAQRFIERVKPDIVYLGNMHGYYINFIRLYKFIQKMDIPCIQIMWDEFPMTGSCTFSFECDKFKKECGRCPKLKDYPSSWIFDNSRILYFKKKSVYDYSKLAFVSVPYTISEAKKSSLLSNKNLFPIDEAIDQNNLFYPRDSRALRNELQIPSDNLVVLTVGVYPSERKGCKYFIELARRFEGYDNISFVHVGFLADRSVCPQNYIAIGFVKDQDLLAQYYSLADIFVCTSFAETQPNTCLEALSCGTRICGFDISGIPTCASSPYGEYVAPKDVNGLVDIVSKLKKKTDQSIIDTRKYAESRFSSIDYNRRLLDVAFKFIR